MRIKRGDSLIEVLMTVALFSVTAISAVGIMNHGIRNTQASLETTMARTEIDSQAEALRFIHDSYATGKNSESFKATWQMITGLAIDPPENGSELLTDITNCSTVYNGNNAENLFNHNAFLINPRALNSDPTSTDAVIRSVFEDGNNNSIFSEASINPRLIYNTANGALYDESPNLTTVQKAEGMWIVAVRDKSRNDGVASYYDFYIHTCWNTPGNNTATNLSTTIRLHNPDSIDSPALNRRYNFSVHYDPNRPEAAAEGVSNMPEDYSYSSYTESSISYTIPETAVPTLEHYIFLGWSYDKNSTVPDFRYDIQDNWTEELGDPIYSFHPEGIPGISGSITLYAIWEEKPEICVLFKPNKDGVTMPGILQSSPKQCVDSGNATTTMFDLGQFGEPAVQGYGFFGWITTAAISPGQAIYKNRIPVSKDDICDGNTHTKCLYAHWGETADYDYQITLSWGDSPSDLDSWLYGVSQNGADLWSSPVYYSNKTRKIDNIVVADLAYDFTSHGYNGYNQETHEYDTTCKSTPTATNNSGNCPEIVTLRNSKIDQKNGSQSTFYFSVWSYSSSYIRNDTMVTIKHALPNGSIETHEFSYGESRGTHRCWNVAKIIGNEIYKIDNATDIPGDNQTGCAKNAANYSGTRL